MLVEIIAGLDGLEMADLEVDSGQKASWGGEEREGSAENSF